MASLVAVAVTVWAVFQLASVKVKGDGAKVHCVLVPMVTVALAVGTVVSLTVKAPVSPPSVAEPSVVAKTNPTRP
jgi:hypothetical protein